MPSPYRSIVSPQENKNRIRSTHSTTHNTLEPEVGCIYPIPTNGDASSKPSMKFLLDGHLEFENNNISPSVSVNNNHHNAYKSNNNDSKLNLTNKGMAIDGNMCRGSSVASPLSINEPSAINSLYSSSSISTNASSLPRGYSVPRTITVLNNNNTIGSNAYQTQDYDLDYDYSSAGYGNNYTYDYDLVYVNASGSFDDGALDHSDVNNDLNKTYNNNNSFLFNNVKFAQSFTSLNSSIDNFFSPPISRAGSPLKTLIANNNNLMLADGQCSTTSIDSILLNSSGASLDAGSSSLNIDVSNKKRKIKNTSLPQSATFSNHNKSSIEASLNFSAFSIDRLDLVAHLAKNENMNPNQVSNVIRLFETENIGLKFNIYKTFVRMDFELSFDFADYTNLKSNWAIKLNKTISECQPSGDAFQMYGHVMLDLIKLLSHIDSFVSCITQEASLAHMDAHQEKNLLEYASNCLQASGIHFFSSDLKVPQMDELLLEQVIYLLWKTEDPSVCNGFRVLVSN